jgi:hypothetical protein
LKCLILPKNEETSVDPDSTGQTGRGNLIKTARNQSHRPDFFHSKAEMSQAPQCGAAKGNEGSRMIHMAKKREEELRKVGVVQKAL